MMKLMWKSLASDKNFRLSEIGITYIHTSFHFQSRSRKNSSDFFHNFFLPNPSWCDQVGMWRNTRNHTCYPWWWWRKMTMMKLMWKSLASDKNFRLSEIGITYIHTSFHFQSRSRKNSSDFFHNFFLPNPSWCDQVGMWRNTRNHTCYPWCNVCCLQPVHIIWADIGSLNNRTKTALRGNVPLNYFLIRPE